MNGVMVLCAVVVIVLGGSGGSGGSGGFVEQWTSRLESLHPDRPLEYFQLAEEVADGAVGDGVQQALARRLYGLAGTLDQEGLGASACLGVLAIARDEPQRRHVEALLDLLQEDRASFLRLRDAAVAGASERVRQDVGVFLSMYRSGRMRSARRQLQEPGVLAMLEATSSHLPAGVEPVLTEVAGADRDRVPGLTESEIIAMLQLEAFLHGHDATTWHGDAMASRLMPLMVIERDALMDVIGEDRIRPFYRGGEWVDDLRR